jgi:hypothetical protein
LGQAADGEPFLIIKSVLALYAAVMTTALHFRPPLRPYACEMIESKLDGVIGLARILPLMRTVRLPSITEMHSTPTSSCGGSFSRATGRNSA